MRTVWSKKLPIRISFVTAARKVAVLLVAVAWFAASAPAAAQTASPSPAASPSVEASPTATPQPFLVAQPVNFTIPVGGAQDIRILGASGTLTAQISSPIGQVSVDQTTYVVHVTAQQLGEATIHIADQTGASVDVLMHVAPPAGTIPASINLTVTGSPAGPLFLQREIEAALDRVIRPTLQAGASISYTPLPAQTQPLQPGTFRSMTMPVTIAGSDALATVSGVVNVNVVNMELPAVQPTLLFYDDDPEYVSGLGVLFGGTVTADAPTRLYYYHDNLGLPKNIAVVLSASAATRVQLIDVGFGPDLDVMSVGHQVSKVFMLAEPRNEGIVADILPNAPFVLRDTMMLAGELVAGAVDVRVLSGGPVTVRVVAFPTGSDMTAYLGGDADPDGHNRHGTFQIGGFGIETLAYSVGGPDASVTYGGKDTAPHNVDPSDAGHDWGDYGVLHRITFDIDNPGDTSQTIYLYEKPLGGSVRSSFVVDGQLQELGCARLPERYLIKAYTMPAQQQAASTVVTMTDGGSSYPLEIGITTTPPLPTTPPLNAPDGCFPKPPPSPVPTEAPSEQPPEEPSAPASSSPLPAPSGTP